MQTRTDTQMQTRTDTQTKEYEERHTDLNNIAQFLEISFTLNGLPDSTSYPPEIVITLVHSLMYFCSTQ